MTLPAETSSPVVDWATHLAGAPGKRLALGQLALRNVGRLAMYEGAIASAVAGQAQPAVPPVIDRRFAASEWQQWPFNWMHQAFLLNEAWWSEATHGVPGVSKHHEDLIAFGVRQWLDIFSPGNQLLGNPVVLRRTAEQGGANLLQGALNLADDARRALAHQTPAGAGAFVVGRNLAATPGKVVLQNRLIELIQYTPTTATVHPEPILIVPAWIMKYYILDLSQHDSLVRYLVDQGHTVFCISWKNPGVGERAMGMDDYLQLGFRDALHAVNAIVPRRRVHAAGYCLGGTLLSIAVAAMARAHDDRLASMTLFAAQTDFSEPGELGLFIDEKQIAQLEDRMAKVGYMTGDQMGGAFVMLRSYDLLWSRLVNGYLLGERAPVSDLMAWNADATRMPEAMHSQYLRHMYLNNDLSEGRYQVDGRPVSLGDIALPTFMVGTVTDHVAPWRSVYKLHRLAPAEIRFVLTSGGHNAGIVSPPGHPHRQYQMLTRDAGAGTLSPDAWLASAATVPGSWWPEWTDWLRDHSSARAKPPRMGSAAFPAEGDAPGRYVLEK